MSTHRHDHGGRGAATAAITGLFAALVLLGGCAARAPEAVAFGPVAEVPAGSFVVGWQRPLPMQGTPVTQLFLGEDKVFACTSVNDCYWLNRGSGFTIALTPVGGAAEHLYPPVAAGEQIIFPSTSRLYVFDHQGQRVRGPGESNFIKLRYAASSPAVAGAKRVYLGLDHETGGWLTAVPAKLQPYDIAPPWELMTNGQLSARPAAYNHIIYAASRDGGVYAVTADVRQPVWGNLRRGVFQTGGEIVADVKADHDGVYVASADAKLYCINPADGRLCWTYYAGHRLLEDSSPVLTADSVYMYVPSVGVVAIDRHGRLETPAEPQAAQPKPADTQSAETQPASAAPAVAAGDASAADVSPRSEIRHHRWALAEARQFLAADDKHVYLRSADNHLLCVDAQSGQVLFRSQRNDFVLFAPNENGKDGTIYAMTAGGIVCAIRPAIAPGGVGELVMNDAR